LRLGPARSRVNGHNRIQMVVFAGQDGFRLNAFQFLAKRLEFGAELALDGLAFPG